MRTIPQVFHAPAAQRRTAATLALLALGTAIVAAPPARADGPGSGTPWIVSVGDSYISGEAGRWAGNNGLVASPSTIDALGPTAYYDNADHTAEVIPRCHRSSSAEVFVGGGIQGKTLACSGATTATDPDAGGYFKPGLDFYDHSGRKGQAKLLEEFARTHNVKLVPLSIGGNDFDFGGIVRECVTRYLEWRGYCKDSQLAKDTFTASNIAKRTADIKNGIVNIASAMQKAGYRDSSYTILVQNYEAAIPRGSDIRYGETYARQYTGGCGLYNKDADWANSTALPTINAAVHAAAVQTRLPNVRLLDLSKAFEGRQLCSKSVGLLSEEGLGSWTDAGAVDKTEWINQIHTVAVGPYFRQESLHPNYWGQRALSNCLRQAYNGGNTRGGVCVRGGQGLNGQGEPHMTLARQLTTPTTTAGAGNPTAGTAGIVRCPSYSVLTGVRVNINRANGTIASMYGGCTPLFVTVSGVSLAPRPITSAMLGTSPRTTLNVGAICPAGSVVTGFAGRVGASLTAVRPQCSKLKADGAVGGLVAQPNTIGASGGTEFPRKTCAAGMAVGFVGRASSASVNYLALQCSELR